MSTYAPYVNSPAAGLGLVLSINTPFGPQKFDIPVEQIAQVAGKAAVDAAWPEIQKRIAADLPGVVDQAFTEAQPKLRAESERAVNSVTMRGAMIAAGLALVMIGTGYWIIQKR